MNEFQKAQNAKILGCYNTDENLIELQKAEILDIEKGGKRALIGEKRTFGGREYIKTSDGWKFHGKGTGTKAQEHAAGTASKTEEKVNSIEIEREALKDKINETRNTFAQTKPGTWKYEEAALKLRAAEKQLKEFEVKNPKKDISSEPTETPSSEAPSTDSRNAAEIKKKALEIMRSKGNADVKLSDFTIRQAKQVIKEHEALGAPKTEKVAEEKKVSSEDIGEVKKAISQLNVRWSPGVHREALETSKYLARLVLKRITGFETVHRAEKWLEKNK
jgi:hypothetical protein